MPPSVAQSASVTAAAAAAHAAPPPAAPAAAGPGDVTAPLAGVVQAIEVQVGAAVEADTRVAVMEAMKTKTVVLAGRAGKVTAVTATVGEAVEVGQTLLTIS